MESKPADLDRAELGAVVERWWGVRASSLAYLPVGFGSHHWLADGGGGVRRFVTVDRIEDNPRLGPDAEAALGALDRAFRTAAALRDEAGLEFVVGPLADSDGSVVRPVGGRYAVAVFPFVEGRSSGFGATPSPDERRAVAGLLARLHDATERLPAALAPRDDLALAGRDGLEAALRDLDRPWTSGPFGERARGLLRALGEDETAALDEQALRLYRARWELADIAEFAGLFRRTHEHTADTAAAYGYLAAYLRR